MELTAANGKKMLGLVVFSHALRFFKDHCLQELSDQSSTRIVNDDIRWVITVPAIWRQPAKQFMRQAAYDVCLCEDLLCVMVFVLQLHALSDHNLSGWHMYVITTQVLCCSYYLL